MKAELIMVSTDVMLGNIMDRSCAYLANLCKTTGIDLISARVIKKEKTCLEKAIADSLKGADLVFLLQKRNVTEKDLFLSDVLNDLSGTEVKEIQERVLPLPADPAQMTALFEQKVLPQMDGQAGKALVSHTVKLCGIQPEKAETMIADLLVQHTQPAVSVSNSAGEIRIRILVTAEDEKEGRKKIKPLIKELKKRFGDYIFSAKKDISLEQAVANLLKDRDLTITTAESCTGGLIASRLLNSADASVILNSAFVTYSNKSKHKFADVKKTTLQKYTAVSGAVVREMARGAAKEAKADVALSSSGILDPKEASKEFPVGLVYLGCSVCGHVTVEKHLLKGDRQRIREEAAAAALVLARKCIQEYTKAN